MQSRERPGIDSWNDTLVEAPEPVLNSSERQFAAGYTSAASRRARPGASLPRTVFSKVTNRARF
jgi:hypothetical protein